MKLLFRQIHFISSHKIKLVVALISGVFLSFLIVFLEPFNTNEFKADNRIFLLSGFGLVLVGVYFFYSYLENFWYYRVKKVWLVWHELFSLFIFFILSGSFIFLYNRLIVNQLEYNLSSHYLYLGSVVLVMIPVMAPLLFFLRQKFGEKVVPLPPNSITISGENKNELINLNRSELLYVKAVENYVDIAFIDLEKKVQTKTFRQTLSKVHKQVPFLEKCHRSFLVNKENIRSISGNSQAAKISLLYSTQIIPLSKTAYNKFKNKSK